MKLMMLLAVLSLLAVASIRAKNIGITLRELPDITSASLPVRQWHAQNGQGQASFGYSYPGQAASNIRDSDGNMAGSWAYVDADGNLIRATYTADERGFLVSSTNEGPVAVAPNVAISDPDQVAPIISDCNAVGRSTHQNPDFRMVGSEEADRNQYPFMVGLSEYSSDKEAFVHVCGGSLITPTKILTAAHCVTHHKSTKLISANLFEVRFGMHMQTDHENDAEQTRSVRKIKIHGEYNPKSIENDLAVLTLSSPVEYTNKVSPICLVPECFNGDNETVTAMGWGHLQYKGENSHALRHAALSVVNNEQCKEDVNDANLPDTALCALSPKQDTCQNDSGGPLVIEYPDDDKCRFKQIGIVSYGDGCAAGTPGVYAKVASFIPWIEETAQL